MRLQALFCISGEKVRSIEKNKQKSGGECKE